MDIYHVYDISVRWWRWLWQRNLSVSCNLSSRGCFDNPVFGDGGIFNVYIYVVCRSLWLIHISIFGIWFIHYDGSRWKTVSVPAESISIDTCLVRLSSEFFGLCTALDLPVLSSIKLCARKSILTMHVSESFTVSTPTL